VIPQKSVFIHKHALVEEGAVLGGGTRVWAFAHVLGGARLGSNCNICDHTFIEDDVILGDNVTIKCGVFLWNGLRLGNNVFVGPLLNPSNFWDILMFDERRKNIVSDSID
jgi:UDP-2-acetamido-3-amino-2,3-dideoxy-glucuronate N-acetyltransferase